MAPIMKLGKFGMVVIVVSKAGCVQCDAAKDVLEEFDVPFEVEDLTDAPVEERKRRLEEAGSKTFPLLYTKRNGETTYVGDVRSLNAVVSMYDE